MSGKVFKGLDYQGRHEAAHAATEVGAEQQGPDGSSIVWGVLYGLIVWLAVSMAAITVWSVR
jgi:hypothetical protein